ncbi:hypothetical protein I4F81_004856 [Pyropia yezoensis]|uniref:Uncharacterized protein n=1 Tax=Pyropia yezoensis TaxID=2788 RepID=A0ACC3BWL7_PYRYE|nr:hypothetical protein I4F81_004856 [Neopyropia yezoensis]
MKCTAFIATVLAVAATASAAAIPAAVRQAAPCPAPPAQQPSQPTMPGQPPAQQPWQPTMPGQPPAQQPWQPAPPQQPWQPAPGQQPWVPQATIENAEGMVTATLGAKTCTLSEALAEGQTLPPSAPVTMQWGTEWVVVRAYPSGETLACKLEEAPADRPWGEHVRGALGGGGRRTGAITFPL